MMILLNGKKMNFQKYPNGELFFRVEDLPLDFDEYRMLVKVIEFTLKYEDDSDLIHLMFLKKYIDQVFKGYAIILNILYMPYSRLDRAEAGFAFTLKYVCELINSLGFEEVTVNEPHSDVCVALLNNCRVKGLVEGVFHDMREKGEFEFNNERDFIYFPDASAEKRYAKLFPGFRHLVGFKHRDFATGKITSLTIVGGDAEPPEVFNVVMVDDLASKGFTFLLGAEKLKALGADKIYLIVGHCEDSVHQGKLLESDLITKIFTTDSILTIPHDKIKVCSLIKSNN
jgi:ribose-phosphate pyrophosphokinase